MIDFDKEVVEKSFEKPVVVDFWAAWCGPCKVLGPVIEQIATEQVEQWELVKIDTELQEDIAMKYRIQSIPSVKMFYRGEVIDEFTGALPRQMILDWLAKALPNQGLLALDELLSKTEMPGVEELNQLMASFPESPEIRIVLSQVILWEDPDRVLEILEPIKMGTPFYDKAVSLRDISAFLLLETDDTTLLEVKSLLQTGGLEEAVQKIIELLTINNKVADGLLTKSAIGIFNTLGFQHPLSKTYRKRLDMVI